MINQEEFEKEKKLIAFKEEINGLIREAKNLKAQGKINYNPHFLQMESADSLTSEDMEWWEIVNRDYKISNFKSKKAFDDWYEERLERVKGYRSKQDPQKEKDRYLFYQEIENKFSKFAHLAMDFEESENK